MANTKITELTATTSLDANTQNTVFVVVDKSSGTAVTKQVELRVIDNRLYSNSPFSQANAAFLKANTPSHVANSAAQYANAAFTVANTAVVLGYTPSVIANTAAEAANTPSHVANSAAIYANSAFITANLGYTKSNSAAIYANGAFNQANAAFIVANTPSDVANSAAIYANGAFLAANTPSSTSNASFNHANSSFSHANLAFTRANSSLLQTGGTISGILNVTGTLKVGEEPTTALPDLIAQFTANAAAYSQVNQQNLSDTGSGDFVVTADNGTDSVNYIDMGFTGSNYSYAGYTVTAPNDGYLFVQGNTASSFGGNLVIGTTTTNRGDIIFVQGGAENANIVARFTKGDGFNVSGNVYSNNTNILSIANSRFNIDTSVKTPTSIGVKDQVSYNSGQLYICVAANTWIQVQANTSW
jgi:hypothetical protein